MPQKYFSTLQSQNYKMCSDNKEIVEMEKVEEEEKAQGRKLIHDRGGLLNIG